MDSKLSNVTPLQEKASVHGRVGYLGPAGTFTEQALLSQSDLKTCDLVPLPRFVDVLQAASDGDVDFGFVAIENAIEGTVNVTLDALAFDHSLLIQREVELDIHLHLMAQSGTRIEDIKTVMSHPVANAQCRKFIQQQLPHAEVKPANSTSDAAGYAASDPTIAAIGPELAATLNELELMAKDLADHKGNRTRFVLVSTSGVSAPTGHDKTTVVLTERHDKPGTLVGMLHEFAARNINLTRLSSRPVKSQLGKYCFIVDFEGHIADDVVADCLRSVMAKHAEVKFLGSYATSGAGSDQSHEEASSSWRNATEWVDGIRSQIDGMS